MLWAHTRLIRERRKPPVVILETDGRRKQTRDPEFVRVTEVYDPDDVGLCNSPPVIPMKVNLQPSPSPPPAVPLPKPSPESSPGPPGRKGSNRSKTRPSQGDAVLAHFMGGGNYSEVARRAGDSPLACDNSNERTRKTSPSPLLTYLVGRSRKEGEGSGT